MNGFSFWRFLAVLRKEWIQVRRDPFTLRMIIALPVMQLFLFGYAINADPKHLPTGLLTAEHSVYERSVVAALKNTGYYDIRELSSEAEAEHELADGDLLFVINIPPNFGRSVDRGEQPSVLMDADATDPTAIGNAAAALGALTTALDRDLPPSLRSVPGKAPFQFQLHAR
ncbi:MAG TPA: ABC transporter permease, partial [Rhodopila sp.]